MTKRLVILIVILLLLVDFAFMSFIVWLGSLVFPYDFTWAQALFVWLVTLALGGILKQKGDK